jgi:hypothetical protein
VKSSWQELYIVTGKSSRTANFDIIPRLLEDGGNQPEEKHKLRQSRADKIQEKNQKEEA